MMNATKEEEVRIEIVKQAQKLFKQFGLKKTTMDEIAEACGKAKSTLYHYFKSKNEVFDAVIDMEMKNLRLYIKSKVDSCTSSHDKIICYITEYHEKVIDMVNVYRIVKHELISKATQKEYFEEILNYERNYLTRLLEDGFDAGELKGFAREDLAWFSEITVTAFFGIVRYSLERDKALDIKKLKNIAEIIVPRVFLTNN